MHQLSSSLYVVQFLAYFDEDRAEGRCAASWPQRDGRPACAVCLWVAATLAKSSMREWCLLL